MVIPAYNAARYVGRAVESVLAQDATAWELVVVDDGSTDDTAALARAAAAGDDRARVVSQPNGGRSAARNHGESLLADTTRYVLFLDADDWLEPAALRRLAGYLDDHPPVGCVGCQFFPVDDRGEPIDQRTLLREKAYRTRWVPGRLGLPRELRPDEAFTPFVTFYTGSGVGPHAAMRRDLFQAIGRYDTRFDGREDQDLFRRLSLASTVHYLPDALYAYRLHPEQSTSDYGKFADELRRLNAKWDALAPSDRDQRERLESARAYAGLVHAPLRPLRQAGRDALRGRWGRAFRHLVSSAPVIATWPYYLLRWNGAVGRSLAEPPTSAASPPEREVAGARG